MQLFNTCEIHQITANEGFVMFKQVLMKIYVLGTLALFNLIRTMFHFYTPLKRQRTKGVIEMEHWREMA